MTASRAEQAGSRPRIGGIREEMMHCSHCNTELAESVKFCSNCGTPAPSQTTGLNTGGGAYVGGGVTTGGDFVGRDNVVHGGYTRTTQSGLQGKDLARLTELFSRVYGQVDVHAAKNPESDAELLKDTAKKVEQEAAKGEKADPDRIKRSLNTLAKLAPDVLEVAVNALTNPVAAVASGVRLVARAFQTASTGTEGRTAG